MADPLTFQIFGRAVSHRKPAWSKDRLSWNFAEWFILSQTFLPAVLYLPGTQPLRVPIRVAAYGISLLPLIYCLSAAKSRRQLFANMHPAVPWLLVALGYLGLMVLHPNTNSLLAGLAQVLLYLSILAPVLWVPACVNDPRQLKRLLWLLLICNGVNSFVGVMQVHNPDFWMPREFSTNLTESEFGLGTVIYEGANGNMIIRPPGLGDTPGAVSIPAVFALYLGLVTPITEHAWWKKILAVAFAYLGAHAIFLTLVRSSFLIALGMVAVFLLVQVSRGRYAQAGVALLVAVAAVAFAFAQSSASGGESLVERFKSLIAEDPLSVYYENRGNQVAGGFSELLPSYPLGAGLGRYGMTNTYFGNPANASSPPIWVEIQWPAWIVDGGIVLLLLYPTALAIAIYQQWRNAHRAPAENTRLLATTIFAVSMGLLALCFSYGVFLSSAGIQFWFLAGALHGVTRKAPPPPRLRRTGAAPVALPRPAAILSAGST